MISRDQIIVRLQDANYKYDVEGTKTEIYRQKNTGKRVGVPRRNSWTVDETRVLLGQAGLTPQEVKKFLGDCIKS